MAGTGWANANEVAARQSELFDACWREGEILVATCHGPELGIPPVGEGGKESAINKRGQRSLSFRLDEQSRPLLCGIGGRPVKRGNIVI